MTESDIPDFDRAEAERRTGRYCRALHRRNWPDRAERRAMAERFRAETTMLIMVDGFARTAARQAGAGSLAIAACLALGRETWGRWRRYRGAALAREMAIVQRKWLARGLKPELVFAVTDSVRQNLERLAADSG